MSIIKDFAVKVIARRYLRQQRDEDVENWFDFLEAQDADYKTAAILWRFSGYNKVNRPRPWAMGAPYTTWEGLKDLDWMGRHLPEADMHDGMPKDSAVVDLFRRPAGGMEPCPQNTSVLFISFAQWFTDSFLRTYPAITPDGFGRTDSNHEIDLCQIYGLEEWHTDMLRERAADGTATHRLAFRMSGGEMWPPLLCDPEALGEDGLPVLAAPFDGSGPWQRRPLAEILEAFAGAAAPGWTAPDGAAEALKDALFALPRKLTVYESRDVFTLGQVAEALDATGADWPAEALAAIRAGVLEALKGPTLHNYDRIKDTMQRWLPEDRKAEIVSRLRRFHATGLDNGNGTLGYTAVNALFLRAHNVVADELWDMRAELEAEEKAKAEEERGKLRKKRGLLPDARVPDVPEPPAWDAERVFQTARLIMNVMLLKIVLEDYVAHIAGNSLKTVVGLADGAPWGRANRIAVEFNMLYRWHSMIPDVYEVTDPQSGARKPIDPYAFRMFPELAEELGMQTLLKDMTEQTAGRIGLLNVPAFMFVGRPGGPPGGPVGGTVALTRGARLMPMNAYREHFGLKRIESYEELVGIGVDGPDKPGKAANAEAVAEALRAAYGPDGIDDVELFPGIFAERHCDEESDDSTNPMGPLMLRMVAYDAFTQALTNPLLSKNLFHEGTFSSRGMTMIGQVSTLADLATLSAGGRPVRCSFQTGKPRKNDEDGAEA